MNKWFLSREETFCGVICQINHINGGLRYFHVTDLVAKYDFDLEEALDPINPKISKNLGYWGADIVLKLTGHIPNNKGYKLYFDNYFTYIEPLIELKSKNIWAVGTLRSDHIRGCLLKSEKYLKKDGRGSYDGAVEKNSMIRIVRWLDNRAVQLAFNFAYMEKRKKRHQKRKKRLWDTLARHCLVV